MDELCFSVANNVVHFEGILEMHNVYNMLTEEARCTARIWCHYTEWYLQICLENFNEVKNGFIWMKYSTQVCHKMSKTGVLKISHGKPVKNGMSCLDYNKNPPLIKEKRQLPYFLVDNWGISKAIHKYGQESIGAL